LKLARIQTTPLVFTLSFVLLAAAANAQEKVLHDFKGSDGTNPYSGLVFDISGNLYGTTETGGASNAGTVFILTPSSSTGKWTESVIHEFKNTDGSTPESDLVFDTSGNLWGATTKGGSKGVGGVFELTGSSGKWTEKVVHDFSGPDGSSPDGHLAFDASGNLYGVTSAGGAKSDGAVYELSSSSSKWSEKVIHSFNGGDGSAPWGGLVADSSGNLYGTTSASGLHAQGTVFELSQTNGKWSEKVLYSFDATTGDGGAPYGNLTFDSSGNLYGTTSKGGANGVGTVFELVTNGKGGWTESILYSFNNNGTDGSTPYGGVLFDSAGNIWGTTSAGGAHGDGTIFELATGTSWTESVAYSFNGASGSTPYAGLIKDSSGNLYGVTFAGGANSKGVVFEYTPSSGAE
jgi:uncharacterized repeat protein (TIGR03803 family)